MKPLGTLLRGWLPAGSAITWLLGLLLAAPATVQGQAAPIAVRVTPAAPAAICAGASQTLTAAAVYPAFVTGSGFNGNVNATAVQSNGKILVGGDFTSYNGISCNYLARLNPDGSLDTGFSTGAGLNGGVWAIAVQSNGSILVGGSFTAYGTTACLRLARLQPAGALDPTFVPGNFTGTVRAIGIQSTGSVVVGGEFEAYGASAATTKYLVRLDANGNLDTGFANITHTTNTNYFNSAVLAIVVQSDDNILVGGRFVRFIPAGRTGIARLSSNGTLDPTFASSANSGPSGTGINAIAEFNGKILVGGGFGGYTSNGNSYPHNCLALLTSLGELDTSFTSGFSLATAGSVNSIAVQSDTRVVVGGQFTAYGGASRNNLVGLTATGGLDANFTVGTGFSTTVNSLAAQAPGKTIVGGQFTTYKGASAKYIARLNTGGNLDDADTPASGATYAWMPGGATTPSITVSPGATTTYIAMATLAGSAATASSVVTVVPLPFVEMPPTYETCAGMPIRIGPSDPNLSYTYSWSPATGLSSSTVANPTVTFANTTTAPTIQNYTLTVRNATGCLSTYFVSVTVNPQPVVSAFTTGPIGATITIIGSGLQGATQVTFAGGVSATPVANTTGTLLTVIVPTGAGDGPLTVLTRCGPISSGTPFGVVRDLVVSPLTPPTIQAGTYTTITVQGGGSGTLTSDVTVENSVVVRDGGVLQLGQYHLTGKGFFQLDAGGTLSLGSAAGLAPGNAGAISMTGSRSYSPDANYIYTGTTAQVTGTALPARVRSLTDNTQSGGQLKLSAPTSVTQVLTVASATDFNLDGKALTLLSDARGTALVVNSAAGKVAGATGTMQRYIDPTFNGDVGYRYYSPPVAGATVATLGTASFTPVVNPNYNTAANPLVVAPFPTVFRFDEQRLGAGPVRPGLAAFDTGLLSPASLTEPLAVGAGYAVSIPAMEKVNFTGTFTTGDQPLALTRSQPTSSGTGWNLVGNPYPAPLNWDLVEAADRPNLDAALYTYESTGPNAGIYFSYVNGIGGSPIVAAGKSFFVRVSQNQSGGRLTLRNRHRLTSYATPAGFARPQGLGSFIELDLESEADFNGGKKGGRPPTAVYGDQLAATFRTTADGRLTASAFNPTLDAYRIPATTGLNLSISAATQNEELAIKAIPEFLDQRVPLTVRVPQAGNYVLNAFTPPTLPSGIIAFLDDAQLGSSIDLSKKPAHTFSVSATQAAVAIAGRFFLRFGPAVTQPLPTRSWTATSDVALYPNPAQSQVTVQIPGLPGATQVEATLLNALGQVVHHQQVALPATGTRLTLAVRGLAPGVYLLRLQANGTLAVRRLVVEQE